MNRTTYLFSRPSFRRGVSRMVDLGGTLNDNAYRYSRSDEEADALALLADWYAVGDDIRAAFTSAHGHYGSSIMSPGRKKNKGLKRVHTHLKKSKRKKVRTAR